MKAKNLGVVPIILGMIIFLQPLVYSAAQSSVKEYVLFTDADAIIADHTIVNRVMYDLVPDSAINHSKETLHIAYGHTSHGSQIITGMSDLPAFKEGKGGSVGLYDWNEGGIGGALDIDDGFVTGDLGNPDRTTWASLTEGYLDNAANSDVNVVMWSWCGQASSATEEDINTYTSLMNDLENDYPEIKFIYMTGHVDGSGLEGNLHIRNEQIREYCQTNGKILLISLTLNHTILMAIILVISIAQIIVIMIQTMIQIPQMMAQIGQLNGKTLIPGNGMLALPLIVNH